MGERKKVTVVVTSHVHWCSMGPSMSYEFGGSDWCYGVPLDNIVGGARDGAKYKVTVEVLDYGKALGRNPFARKEPRNV